MEYTKTELHTHLVGMLSVEEFVQFIKNIGVNSFRFDDRLISPDELLKEKNRKFIEVNEKIPYEMMKLLYSTRTDILKRVVDEYSRIKGISKTKASEYIYNKLMNDSLRSLVKQGVKYVEISYSFQDRIMFFRMDDDLKGKIKCKFLLSTERTTPAYSTESAVRSFEKAAKSLQDVLNNGNGVGFDILGEETKLTDQELDYNDKTNSFMVKLELLFDTLLMYDNTTLRVHSGETNCSFTNTINVLKMIDLISKKRNIVIPPPEIRIGHGLYFDGSKEYIDLLKKFKCIIEINATSNLKLSNVESLEKMPYNFYLSHGIPVVICTDGHGIYLTTIPREDKIARAIIGTDEGYQRIVDFDNEVLSQKGK